MMKPNAGGSPQKPASRANAFGGVLHWMRSRKGALVLVSAFAVVAWAKPMGLLLWARIRILTSIPKTAIADDPSRAVDQDQPVAEFDTGLPGSGAAFIDPFSIDRHTPRIPDNQTPSQPSIAPTQKSDERTAEVQALEVLEAARRAAERFRLQSAGRGLSMAVIDGRTYRVGDALEGADGHRFVLLEVLEGGAVLGHGDTRIEIHMRGANRGTAPSGRENNR
jgi:hypothetical protein